MENKGFIKLFFFSFSQLSIMHPQGLSWIFVAGKSYLVVLTLTPMNVGEFLFMYVVVVSIILGCEYSLLYCKTTYTLTSHG